jgi:hypothetical protein
MRLPETIQRPCHTPYHCRVALKVFHLSVSCAKFSIRFERARAKLSLFPYQLTPEPKRRLPRACAHRQSPPPAEWLATKSVSELT